MTRRPVEARAATLLLLGLLACESRDAGRPPEEKPEPRQVRGDTGFSSGHAAMQALDPRVHEIWLDYTEG